MSSCASFLHSVAVQLIYTNSLQSTLSLIVVVLIFWVTKVAKSALEKALAENEDIHNFSTFIDSPADIQQPLVVET